MSARAQVSVLVADDHPLYRNAVANAVQMSAELALVAEESTGRAALEAILGLEPDVAILDVRMADFGGVEVAAEVTQRRLRTRIVLLSAYPQAGLLDRKPELRSTVSGYLTKDASGVSIRAAILAAARGERLVGRPSAGEGAGGATGLSARELEVLALTADGASAPEIAAELFLSPTTVKTHLQHAYAKLGVTDRAAAVAEGMRRGLLD